MTFSDGSVGGEFEMADWSWSDLRSFGLTNVNSRFGNPAFKRDMVLFTNGTSFGGGGAEKTASQTLEVNLEQGRAYVLTGDFGQRIDNAIASPPVLRLYAGNVLLVPSNQSNPALIQGQYVTWSNTYVVNNDSINGPLRIEIGIAANTVAQQLNIDHITLTEDGQTVNVKNPDFEIYYKRDRYNYTWNTVPEQTTRTAIGLSDGTYEVTVTDDDGCMTTAEVVVYDCACAFSDIESPIIPLCPVDTTVNNDPGLCSAFVELEAPNFRDNCPLFGSSLDFERTDNIGELVNDHVVIPDDASLNGLTELTMEAWIYMDVAHTWQTIMMKGNYGYGLSVSNNVSAGGLRLRYWNQSDGAATPFSSPTISVGEWVHVAVTVDATQTTFYVNGSESGTSSLNQINNNSGSLMLGKQGTTCSKFLGWKVR